MAMPKCVPLKNKVHITVSSPSLSQSQLCLSVSWCHEVTLYRKLQALVYDILSSTTALFSYAIGSRKLSAKEQFFVVVGAQRVVSLLETTQIISDVCFVTDHVAYASTNKTKTA